jgi:putative ABC transport system ATP-binding protein
MTGVSKRYRSGEVWVDVLRDVDLTIEKGEFVVLLGVSGSGKTTLLNLIGALDRPTSGEVTVDGQLISSANARERTAFRRAKIGFVFQFYNLLPTLVAAENVEAALEILPLSRREVGERARRYLEAVGLGDKLEKLPAQLSGGEQQRVAIARALAKEPSLLLADEPTGNLDEETGLSIIHLMRDLHRLHQTTVILVTHNPRLAEFADRVLRIEHTGCVPVPLLSDHTEPA